MRERPAVIAAALLVGGCVYPAHEPTGLELSWRFFEGNPADGDASKRVRSCSAVFVSTMWMNVYDDDDEDRTGTFRFPCDDGFQTISEFQTEASDAFLRLGSGDYRVELFSRKADGELELLAERTFDVNGRGVTVEPWLLTRPTFDWEIVLAGADTCQSLSLRLDYADAEAALPELAIEDQDEDEEPDVPLAYRDNLSSDRGLLLGGQEQSCAGFEGAHVVAQMDRGDYLLEVIVDGRTCEVPLSLEPFAEPTMIDLNGLTCDA